MQYIAGNPRRNLNGEVLEVVKPVCPHCKSGEVYVKQSGTIVCRRCGQQTPQAKEGTKDERCL